MIDWRRSPALTWHHYDAQTQLAVDTKVPATFALTVAHGASAIANLREVGNDIWRVNPQVTIVEALSSDEKITTKIFLLPLYLLKGFAISVLNLILMPFRVAKDLGDAAAHGIMRAIDGPDEPLVDDINRGKISPIAALAPPKAFGVRRAV